MAYYYFDTFDHVSTKHNSDVYLVANVGNYHDFNGEEYASYFAGFTIKGGCKFTLGGNYTYDVITGNTIFNINRFQQVRNQSSEGAAIMFDGSGTFVIASQIGAPDGAKHDDRAVQIRAENCLSNASYVLPEPSTAIDFNIRVQPTPNAWNSSYKQTGQNADISGVHAKNGTLTIASHYNGTITVKGGHSSRGMLDSTGKALINTTVNTHSVATGLRGDKAIRFNGNFYGNLDVTQRTHLQTLNKVLTDNISAAYGVWTSSDLNQSNTWAGGIFTCTQKNYFDATIAYGVDGKQSAANGVLKNNTVESICIKANSIYINHLDYEPNTSGHGSFNPIAEPDNLATYKNFSITVNGATTTKVSDANEIGATMSPGGVDFYYIEAPKSMQNLNLNIAVTINYNNPIKNEIHSASGTLVFKDGIRYIRMAASDTTEKLHGWFKDDSAEVPTNTTPMTDYWEFSYGTTPYRFTKEELVLDEAGTKFYYPKTDTSTPISAILTWDATAVPNAQYIIYLDNDYTVHATADNSGSKISKVEIFDAFGNPITGVVKTSTVQLVNGQFKLELDTSFNAYKVENVFQYDPSKGFSSVLETHDNNKGKLTLTFIANTNNLTNFEAEFDLITSDPSYFQSKTSNVDLSNFKLPMITSLGGGLYLYTLESKDLDKNFIVYKDLPANVVLKAKTEGNVFKVDGDVENNKSDTMTDNKIQAIAIEAQDKVEIRNFSKGSVIEVAANSNTIISTIGSGADNGNMIAAIGIKGKTVQLHDFNGTIDINATNNKIQHNNNTDNECENSLIFAGIEANTLNVSKNLYGNFDIYASGNRTPFTTAQNSTRGDWHLTANVHSSSEEAITAAIFTDNMNVDGFIESTISVYANNGTNTFSAGIYVTDTLDAKGFSGSITVFGNGTMSFGLYAKTFDSEIGYYFDNYDYTYPSGIIGRKTYAQDVFNVEGDITVTGYGDRVCAIATCDVANLYLNGYIYSSRYAVKTDYGKDVNSGFNNDWVAPGANAEVTAFIDLGGGKNRLTFDSGAKFYGHVVHDVGTTNITYQLNGAAQTDAIHNVNSECDATLVSGTTITIDCNNMKLGDTYTLIDYDDYMFDTNKNCDIADARWTNSYVTVSYQGYNNTVYINGGVSDIVAITGNNGKKFYAQLRYDENTNTLYFASDADKNAQNPENIVKPVPNIAVFSITTSIDPQTKAEKEAVSITGGSVAMQTTFEAAMKNLNNGAAPNYVIYDIDDASRTATADTAIYWMCEAGNYKNSSYEIEYTVRDAQGNAVSTAVLRLTTINENDKTFNGTIKINGETQDAYGKIIFVDAAGKTQEQILKEDPTGNTPFNGKYYIMSYDINSIPDGCTVEYQIRDYISEGTLVSDWVSGSINTNVQDFSSTIKDIDSSSMIAVSPDTKTMEITNSMALFTWEAAEGNYPVDKYTVQYFSSSVNLNADAAKRQILFDAYTYADKDISKYDTWQAVKDEAGNIVPNLEIRLVKGDGSTPAEIQIREVVEEIEVFGTTQYVYQYYNFVSKEVTSTELLASALINQTYVYWRVQATSSSADAIKNNWVEGNSFTVGVINSPNNPPSGAGGSDPEDPEDPEDPAETTKAPVGTFSSLEIPTLVPEFKDVLQQKVENGVPQYDENGEAIMEIVQEFATADITFSWTDNFTATSENAEIAYIFQVSNSQDFDSDRTETILLLSQSMSEETVLKIYANAQAKYAYVDEEGNVHDPLVVYNGVDSWRVASGSSYTTTVTFDNSYPTIPVGMFVNQINYWQVKAIDTYGNEAEYCNVQSFKPTYTVTETYTQINPETGELEELEREVTKYIVDLAPAKAYDLKIKTPEQEDNKNTGKVELSFYVDNTAMGIDEINITINGKDISGNKLPTDVLTVKAVIIHGTDGNRVEFIKELTDTITINGLTSSQYLADGTYTVSVTTSNSHGAKTTSDTIKFIQDTTRPVIQTSGAGGVDQSTISATFSRKAESSDRITVTVSWPIATDNFDGKKASSNIKGYYLYYKSNDATNWQAVRINNSTLLTDTQCDITLTNGAKYDFKVIAVDKSNNQSDPVEVKGIEIFYSDIDDNYVRPVIPPLYEAVSFTNEVIGGDFDPEDKIHVSTDNNLNKNAGRMVFTVKNLTQIRGKGNSITISLYEDNGGLTLLKTYTVSGTSAAKTSTGLSFEYLFAESGKQYVFEVKSANSTTVMKYDFNYEFVYFNGDLNNNTAYQLTPNYTVEFDNTMSNPVPVPEDLSGQIRKFDVKLPGQTSAGYGDAVNFSRLTIDTDGKYSFNVSKSEKDSRSALKVTIYAATAGSSTLKTVKSFTVAANKAAAAINELELKAGDYIIQVTSPGAAKGANINYSINVSSSTDKYYAWVDNSDDSYTNAKSTVSVYDAKTNTNAIFGSVIEEEGQNVIYSEFIGKTDLSDFRKITVDESGKYTFMLHKFTYFNTVQEKELAYGTDGTLTLTIYELVDGKSALKKVKSISVSAKNFEKELETYLAKGEYYVEVKAASSKTALDYFVTMQKHEIQLNTNTNNPITYKAEGNFNIDDNVINEKVITDKVGEIYYFNNESNIEEQKNTFEFIGYGEARNYFKVTFEKDGDYTFSVNTYDDREKNKADSHSANYSKLKAVIYKANDDGIGFTAVKTINLSASKVSASAQLKGLEAGEYYIEIVASEAASGKYSLYNLSVKTDYIVNASSYNASTKEFADFTKAEAYTVGTVESGDVLTVINDVHYYKFETGTVAGKYNFSFGNEGTYKVYVLKDGAVKLTEVKIGTELAAYFDADTTVYIAASSDSGNANVNFKVETDSTLAKDIAPYNNDNNAADAAAIAVNAANPAVDFSSWVGYGDLESWRKLTLDEAGSFNLSLEKTAMAADSAMTVTVYQFTSNGASPKSVGTFTVKAGSIDGMKNFMLGAGEYYIQVKASAAQSNVDFKVTVSGDNAVDKKCLIAKADNTDDTIITDKVLSVAGSKINDEWVGYSDEYDYFNIEVAKSGYYDFTFSNSDAAQVTLYVVNPATNKLTALATYTAKTTGTQTVFVDKNGNPILLNSNSQYIVMVKSTNASKGGNCDYSFEAQEHPNKYQIRFTVSPEEEGKYTFVDFSSTIDYSDFTIEKYNSATGKTSAVSLNSAGQLKLTAGDYFLTSANSDIQTLNIDIDDNSKLFTIS